jgi:uncharacterized protein YkwD
MRVMMIRRTLLAGAIVLTTGAAGVALAVTAHAGTNSYEAEAAGNTVAGGARVARCAACSGRQKVGYLGNNAGTLQFNDVTVDSAGPAKLTITYTSGGPRSAQLSVNGAPAQALDFPSTGSFGTAGTLDTTVTLHAGANTLAFANSAGWAPDLDKIAITPADVPAPTTPPVPTTPPPSTSPTAPPASPSGPPEEVLTQEAAVVTLVNQERAKAGCQPLRMDDRLTAAARGHSADMAARGYFDHTTPEGVSFADRITKAGYRWMAAAENIAKGQRDPASVMNSWMNSPGHRTNILNCGYKDIGVGLAYDSGKTPLWTQDFGSQ